jgi:hypothetical protein
MTRSPYTRSGTRRLGDDYQDLIACEVLIDWLEHSERYAWVRVEADDAKFLDDVVAMLSDGRLIVKQVKFSTNPEGEDDPLTWEKLLAAPPGKSARARMSLLKKWATSLRELLANSSIAEASVVSNRTAGDDLRVALNSATGLVDFDRIADDVVRAEVVRQLDGESEARQFFGQFQFRLNEPSLNDLESSLRRRFDRLGGSETGWLNLKSEVRFWVAHRYEPPPDGAIQLSDVTRAARWHALQSLSQRFNVPRDYVVPSEEFHRDLESSLLSTGSGCYVITASPGVGKSTYTSYLYEQLKKQDTPVIRHHYYLSQDDQTGVARLAHIRAAESLMYDLTGDYAEALGAHAGENPVARSLREWLIACGGFYARQGKMLVVIIDGLDHVWRDTRSVEELTKLLQLVLPAPEGVVVLLATQPVDDSQLPPILLKYAPRDTWPEIRPLDHEVTIVQRVGNWAPMTGEDESSLRELLKELKPYQAIVDKAVSLVREMADRPKARGTIGKQLSAVVLQRDITQHALSRYYSTSVGHKMYVPDEIVGISDTWRHAHADREVWIESPAGPETWVIPKVKANAPCPCRKSGKRYKDCCGRPRAPKRARELQQTSEARRMIFRGVARQERPDFNDQELQDWVRQNWVSFARLAYGQYIEKGRGAIFINLAEAVIDNDGIYFEPVYIADNSKELEARGGWPEDEANRTVNLIATYDPEQVMVFIFTRKGGRVSTIYMGTDHPDFTPKHLYETALKRD